jgi:hypothetical protein
VDALGQTTRKASAPVYRAGDHVAAGLPASPARFVMFEFVVIEVSLLLKMSARGAGDGANIRRLLCDVKHFFQELFLGPLSTAA